jgi:hypothetical protein
VSVPPVLSRSALVEPGPEALRDFLEALVSESATRADLVIGEADPGRYVLVSPPMEPAALKGRIDAAIEVVVERFGRRWPAPHVTDLGLRELYADAREPWIAPRGFEALVKDGKLGVVTIFCHEWVYELCAQIAGENGFALRSSLDDYLATGKLRVAGTNTFRLDVFSNLRDLAANFDPIDVLAARILVLAGLKDDPQLAGRTQGKPNP